MTLNVANTVTKLQLENALQTAKLVTSGGFKKVYQVVVKGIHLMVGIPISGLDQAQYTRINKKVFKRLRINCNVVTYKVLNNIQFQSILYRQVIVMPELLPLSSGSQLKGFEAAAVINGEYMLLTCMFKDDIVYVDRKMPNTALCTTALRTQNNSAPTLTDGVLNKAYSIIIDPDGMFHAKKGVQGLGQNPETETINMGTYQLWPLYVSDPRKSYRTKNFKNIVNSLNINFDTKTLRFFSRDVVMTAVDYIYEKTSCSLPGLKMHTCYASMGVVLEAYACTTWEHKLSADDQALLASAHDVLDGMAWAIWVNVSNDFSNLIGSPEYGIIKHEWQTLISKYKDDIEISSPIDVEQFYVQLSLDILFSATLHRLKGPYLCLYKIARSPYGKQLAIAHAITQVLNLVIDTIAEFILSDDASVSQFYTSKRPTYSPLLCEKHTINIIIIRNKLQTYSTLLERRNYIHNYIIKL